MKVIRHTYPKEISIGLLLLIFGVSFFLSSQIFRAQVHELELKTFIGMLLVGAAVVIMALVLWEEFLFPLRIKPVEGGFNFRNHRNKLRKQLLIYLEYEINAVRYFIWAGVCIVFPIVGKLFSGIKNYNDFLTLTTTFIEYRNNEKRGKIGLNDIQRINLVKDEGGILHKFGLVLSDNSEVMIDLDEMEVEAFYESIDSYINETYKGLLKR
ncbi:MAG: heavy metal transporter [Bacteroidetes bacterium]|nr:heavy metal transporter [Bacteroidota bacterium]